MPKPQYTPTPTTERERESPVWDISQERACLEPLLNQRFNFFLVFFSLVAVGSVNAREQEMLWALLLIGAVVTTMLLLVLLHTQEKLDLTLGILLADTSHPASAVQAACTSKTKRGYIGKWIPLFCTSVLWIGFALSLLGILHVPSVIASPSQPEQASGQAGR